MVDLPFFFAISTKTSVKRRVPVSTRIQPYTCSNMNFCHSSKFNGCPSQSPSHWNKKCSQKSTMTELSRESNSTPLRLRSDRNLLHATLIYLPVSRALCSSTTHAAHSSAPDTTLQAS